VRHPPEGKDEPGGEEADRESLGVDFARVAEEVGRRKDPDPAFLEFVPGEVPELPEDDEKRPPDDEPGEDGV